MFAVSGPGILLLSIFAVPACGLLFVLWKPKKQQSAPKDLPSDVIAPSSGGSLRQAKYESQEEPSSSPAPEYQVEEEISNEHGAKIKIVKLNTDEEGSIAMKYGINSIPTMNVFVGGQVVKSIVGARPKPALLKELSEYIN